LLFVIRGRPQVSEALHVASVALESNNDSEELWLVYLKLFRRQGKQLDRSKYTELCESALQRVPTYNIFLQVSVRHGSIRSLSATPFLPPFNPFSVFLALLLYEPK